MYVAQNFWFPYMYLNAHSKDYLTLCFHPSFLSFCTAVLHKEIRSWTILLRDGVSTHVCMCAVRRVMYLALSDQSSVVSVKITVAALYTDAMVLDGGGGVNNLITTYMYVYRWDYSHTC